MRSNSSFNEPGVCHSVSDRRCHADSTAGLATIILRLHLDVAGFDPRAAEPLVRAPALYRRFETGRLAGGDLAFAGRAALWSVLGDVELLFFSEVYLSHARNG